MVNHKTTTIRKNDLKQIEELIALNRSFFLIGMPALGISTFIHLLINQSFAHFVHIDLYKLVNLDKTELYRLVVQELGGQTEEETDSQLIEMARRQIKALTDKYSKVVLVFNRFDQLQSQFDGRFFLNLKSLVDVQADKVTLIFAANKPLAEINSQALIESDPIFFSHNYYLKPYTADDLMRLHLTSNLNQHLDKDYVESCIKLSGGHLQLFNLLLKSERISSPLLDQFIKLQLQQLYNHLNYHQKKILNAIAHGKKPAQVDQLLIDLGYLIQDGEQYHPFTPLLTDFILDHQTFSLPDKEAKLFQLLKSKLNQTVDKDEIYSHLWGEDGGSEWALNALIYRLRKNKSFIKSGFLIENHKKRGYQLVEY